MKPFETTDELYTCLFSDGRPVEVLAKAMSIVEVMSPFSQGALKRWARWSGVPMRFSAYSPST